MRNQLVPGRKLIASRRAAAYHAAAAPHAAGAPPAPAAAAAAPAPRKRKKKDSAKLSLERINPFLSFCANKNFQAFRGFSGSLFTC